MNIQLFYERQRESLGWFALPEEIFIHVLMYASGETPNFSLLEAYCESHKFDDAKKLALEKDLLKTRVWSPDVFAEAVKNGNIPRVLCLLRGNEKDDRLNALHDILDGNPPLIAAAISGNLGMLKALLREGAFPMVWSVRGYSLLEEAGCAGHKHIVNYLLQSPFFSKQENVAAALFCLEKSLVSGKKEVARSLVDYLNEMIHFTNQLDQKVRESIVEILGRCLMLLIKSADYQLLDRLFNFCVEKNLVTESEGLRDLLGDVLDEGDPKLCSKEFLDWVSSKAKNLSDADRPTPLYFLEAKALGGWLSSEEIFASSLDKEDWLVLASSAAWGSHETLVDTLLERMAHLSLSLSVEEKFQVLSFAVDSGNKNLIEKLADQFALPVSDHWNNLLIRACGKEDKLILEYLFSRNEMRVFLTIMDENAKKNLLTELFTSAIQSKKTEIVKFLLEKFSSHYDVCTVLREARDEIRNNTTSELLQLFWQKLLLSEIDKNEFVESAEFILEMAALLRDVSLFNDVNVWCVKHEVLVQKACFSRGLVNALSSPVHDFEEANNLCQITLALLDLVDLKKRDDINRMLSTMIANKLYSVMPHMIHAVEQASISKQEVSILKTSAVLYAFSVRDYYAAKILFRLGGQLEASNGISVLQSVLKNSNSRFALHLLMEYGVRLRSAENDLSEINAQLNLLDALDNLPQLRSDKLRTFFILPENQNVLFSFATSHRRMPLLETLCAYGFNVNRLNAEYSHQIFSVLIRQGNLKMLEFLLDRGAKVDFVDKLGNTLLMVAAENGNRSVLELLLTKGRLAFLKNAVNNNRVTAWEFALAQGHFHLCDLLYTPDHPTEAAWISAISEYSFQIYKFDVATRRFISSGLVHDAIFQFAQKEGCVALLGFMESVLELGDVLLLLSDTGIAVVDQAFFSNIETLLQKKMQTRFSQKYVDALKPLAEALLLLSKDSSLEQNTGDINFLLWAVTEKSWKVLPDQEIFRSLCERFKALMSKAIQQDDVELLGRLLNSHLIAWEEPKQIFHAYSVFNLLSLAVQNKNEKVLKHLLMCNYQLSEKNFLNLLRQSLDAQHPQILELLLNSKTPQCQEKHPFAYWVRFATWLILEDRKCGLIRYLSQQYPHILNPANVAIIKMPSTGETLLMCAIRNFSLPRGREMLVEFVKCFGVNNAPNRAGQTPVSLAVDTGDIGIVDELFAHCASEEKMVLCKQALQYARDLGDRVMEELLVDRYQSFLDASCLEEMEVTRTAVAALVANKRAFEERGGKERTGLYDADDGSEPGAKTHKAI